MKANKNSVHAKLYRFTYIADLPQNLCPYFWKLVFAFFVLIPNFIIQIPSLIVMLFVKNHGLDDAKERRSAGCVLYIAMALLYGYIHITTNWIKAMFDAYSYEQGCANAGWAVNSMIFIVLAIWGIVELTKKRRSKVNRNIEAPSIISEFIKAKYNRYCPKIDWE